MLKIADSLVEGVKMLLTACENETHIDLIVNALKVQLIALWGVVWLRQQVLTCLASHVS